MIILCGKKRAFNSTPNYLISMLKNGKNRGSDNALGKLRATKQRDKFTLYDNGENFSKKSSYTMD
jgi:hypothetical protein